MKTERALPGHSPEFLGLQRSGLLAGLGPGFHQTPAPRRGLFFRGRLGYHNPYSPSPDSLTGGKGIRCSSSHLASSLATSARTISGTSPPNFFSCFNCSRNASCVGVKRIDVCLRLRGFGGAVAAIDRPRYPQALYLSNQVKVPEPFQKRHLRPQYRKLWGLGKPRATRSCGAQSQERQSPQGTKYDRQFPLPSRV